MHLPRPEASTKLVTRGTRSDGGKSQKSIEGYNGNEAKKMTFEVQSFNIKSRSTISKLIVAGFIAIMGLALLISLPNQKEQMIIPFILLGVILTLTFPLVLTIIMTSKVIFEEDKVTRVSVFGKKTIYLDDLRSFGTFIQSKYFSRLVEIDELDEKEYIDTNMIFLSESSTFDLNEYRMQRHIRLEYRKEVYQKISEWVKAANERK